MTKDILQCDALFKLQYGMYVVTAKRDEQLNGQIATVVSQITSEPIQVVTCLSKNTLTQEMILQTGKFGVSVLEQDTPMKFIGHFGFRSGRDFDKFEEMDYRPGDATGVPLVMLHAIAVMEAEVSEVVDVGSHRLFIANLLSAQQVKSAPAMTYEYYHTVSKGKSPKNAPTYQGDRKGSVCSANE